MSFEYLDTDPKSTAWREAFRRFVYAQLPSPSQEEIVVLKDCHHTGWRAGVASVRQEGSPRRNAPAYLHDRLRRKAWEHGAVAGRRAALTYVEEQQVSPKELK